MKDYTLTKNCCVLETFIRNTVILQNFYKNETCKFSQKSTFKTLFARNQTVFCRFINSAVENQRPCVFFQLLLLTNVDSNRFE